VQQRYVFLHYHIFKNSGTTVDWILEKNFPGGFESIHEPVDRGIVSNEEIMQFLVTHPRTVALSSHHFQLPFPTHEAIRFIEIAFLRHPLDQLQSMYYYYKRIENPSVVNSVKAQQLGIADWLRWMMDAEPYNVFNLQTAFFGTSGAWAYPPGEAELERAKAVVRSVRFLGVVERFDESLVAAEHFLRVYFPDLDLSYLTFNARDNRPSDLQQRLDQMREACGDELDEELDRVNDLDHELWRVANAELDRRLAHIAGVPEKLSWLRVRKERLRRA